MAVKMAKIGSFGPILKRDFGTFLGGFTLKLDFRKLCLELSSMLMGSQKGVVGHYFNHFYSQFHQKVNISKG